MGTSIKRTIKAFEKVHGLENGDLKSSKSREASTCRNQCVYYLFKCARIDRETLRPYFGYTCATAISQCAIRHVKYMSKEEYRKLYINTVIQMT